MKRNVFVPSAKLSLPRPRVSRTCPKAGTTLAHLAMSAKRINFFSLAEKAKKRNFSHIPGYPCMALRLPTTLQMFCNGNSQNYVQKNAHKKCYPGTGGYSTTR
eukprot:3801916-Rhodomonas_salina.1